MLTRPSSNLSGVQASRGRFGNGVTGELGEAGIVFPAALHHLRLPQRDRTIPYYSSRMLGLFEEMPLFVVHSF